MSLIVGQRFVRTDDGMQGVVESVELPGYEHLKEPRIVYFDRGEKRIAGKREVWTLDVPPPRKLRTEEIIAVAFMADRMLRALDESHPFDWWRRIDADEECHDPELVRVIGEYLQKRG